MTVAHRTFLVTLLLTGTTAYCIKTMLISVWNNVYIGVKFNVDITKLLDILLYIWFVLGKRILLHNEIVDKLTVSLKVTC